MTQAEADNIILAELRAILSRGEPPSRLLDDYVKCSLMQRHPAIAHFLPCHENTIFEKYVLDIDMKSMDELTSFVKRLPGYINVSLDGVTVNGKQKVRCFLHSIFVSDIDSH